MRIIEVDNTSITNFEDALEGSSGNFQVCGPPRWQGLSFEVPQAPPEEGSPPPERSWQGRRSQHNVFVK